MSWKRHWEFRWQELEFRKWHRILVYNSIDGRCYNDKYWWKNRGWTRERHIRGSWGVGGWMRALLCAEWAHFDWVVKGGCPKSFSTREIQVYKVSRETLQTKDKLFHSRPSCETLESMASMAIYGSYRFLCAPVCKKQVLLMLSIVSSRVIIPCLGSSLLHCQWCLRIQPPGW